VEQHGRLGAIERAGEDRRLIELAAAFGADESFEANYLYSGFCLAALPHSRQPDEAVWRVENGRVVLLVEPGRRTLPGQPIEYVGVPYGATARILLLYLQDRAVKSGSRHIEFGPSLYSWFQSVNRKTGGSTYKRVRDQAERIGLCRFSFHAESDGLRTFRSSQFVEQGVLFLDARAAREVRQRALFDEGVVLSEAFFKALTEHAVPVEERAIRTISESSVAIDIYCWLAYRLHSLKRPIDVSWAALRTQFGHGYGRMVDFRRAFLRDWLPAALTVYPEAAERGIEVIETGLRLRQVRPPIMIRAIK